MRHFASALALIALPISANAAASPPVAATSAERASGFRDLADCQGTLDGAPGSGQADADKTTRAAGTLFNRAHGNISRCEMVEGEALIVVYPAGTRPAG